MKEKYRQVEQNVKYEKLFRNYEEIQLPNVVDDDFWKINEESPERNEEKLTKGLWIMSLDSDTISHTASLPALPKTKIITTKIPTIPKVQRLNGKANLEEQQEKYLKLLQEKQPLGRDGKRIPLPVIPRNKSSKNSTFHKSGEAKLSKYSGFN